MSTKTSSYYLGPEYTRRLRAFGRKLEDWTGETASASATTKTAILLLASADKADVLVAFKKVQAADGRRRKRAKRKTA
jgi:hypothetical protein